MNWRLLVIAGILGCIGTAAVFANSLVYFVLVCASLFWIGIPCIATGIILFFYARAKKTNTTPVLRFIGSVLLVSLFALLSLPFSSFVERRDIAAAKAYPEKIAPLLEQYRQANGVYPTSLDALPSKPSVPRLLRTAYGYRSDGTNYSFCFSEPGGIMDTWDYSSKTHEWHFSS